MINNRSNPEINIFDFFRIIYKKMVFIILVLLIPILFFAYQIVNAEKNFKISFQFLPLSNIISNFENYNNDILLFNEKKLSSLIPSIKERNFKVIKPKQLFEIYLSYLKDMERITFEDIFKINDNDNSDDLINFNIEYSQQNDDIITLESKGVKDKGKWKNYILEINKKSEKFVRKVVLNNFSNSKKFFEENADVAIKDLRILIEANKQKLLIISTERNKQEKKVKSHNLENYLYLNEIGSAFLEKKLQINSLIFDLERQIIDIKNAKIDLKKLYKSLNEGSIFKDDFKMVSFKNFQIETETNLNYKLTLIITILTLLFIILYIFSVYQKEQIQRN